MLPEGTLAELIDAQIFMSPSPLVNHQRILLKIYRQLFSFVEAPALGEILVSPCDVYLDETRNVVQPDVIVVLKSSAAVVEDFGHVHGTPDILVEILSPSNREHDLVKKRTLYEKFGVKEYWVVDPETKVALVFAWHDGVFVQVGSESGFLHSTVLDVRIEF